MTTKAPSALYNMYDILTDHGLKVRKGGVVGDVSHQRSGGYHISREDLLRWGFKGDYSVQAPADKRGPANCASAIDLTLSDADMKTVSFRLKAAFQADDPRIDCLREFIGTINGRDVCGYNRYQTGRAVGWYASGYSDKTHLWHVHLSFFRDYCDQPNEIAGVAEVVLGLKAGTLGWKGSTSTPSKPAPKPTPSAPSNTEEIDLSVTPEQLFEADVIAAPPELVTATNKKWTLRGYLQNLVIRQIRIEKKLDQLIKASK